MKKTNLFEDLGDGTTKLVHASSGNCAVFDSELRVPLEEYIARTGRGFYRHKGVWTQIGREEYTLPTILAYLKYDIAPDVLRRIHRNYCLNGDGNDCRLENWSYRPTWNNPNALLEFDSEHNAIYRVWNHYYIWIKDDSKLVSLGCRKESRDRVIELIKGSCIIYKRESGKHVMVKPLRGKSWRLAAEILAEHNPSYTFRIVNSGITYKDNNPLNLSPSNIVSKCVPTDRNYNRTIVTLKDRIYIQIGKDREFEILENPISDQQEIMHHTDNDPDMQELLKMPWATFNVKSHGRLVLKPKSKKLKEMYIYHVRLALLKHGPFTNIFDLAIYVEKMLKEYKDAGNGNHREEITVDHLDQNCANDDKWNLRETSKASNSATSHIVDKIFKPFLWFAANTADGIRVYCGTESDMRKHICRTNDEYDDLLFDFFKNGFGAEVPPCQIKDGERFGYAKNMELTDEGHEVYNRLIHSDMREFIYWSKK